MSAPWTPGPSSRRADLPIAEGELDDDLTKLVRRTSWLRQGFYFVVLLVALAGQVSGAVEALGIPLFAAIPAVAALELGGIVVLANADVRRRLGERAFASRLLSAAIATSAVAFNWLAHRNHLLGGFFAGMSALGYLVWLMHTENQRRDRLRVKGDLPPTTPSYEIVGHWLRHPWLTVRAKAMAKADPRLGLYDSLAAARAEVKKERRQSAIAKVLHRKIKAAVDPRTADIAIAVYDLDEIAGRLAEQADYDGLTAIIAADLAPQRLAPNGVLEQRPPTRVNGRRINGAGRGGASDRVNGRERANGVGGMTRAELNGVNGHGANGHEINGLTRLAIEFSDADALEGGADVEDVTVTTRAIDPAPAQREVETEPETAGSRRSERAARRAAVSAPSLITPDLRQDVERRLGQARTPAPRTAPDSIQENAALWEDPSADATSLRRRVHAALDAAVHAGDQREEAELIGEVFDTLELDPSERIAAANYVYTWRRGDVGQRIRTA